MSYKGVVFEKETDYIGTAKDIKEQIALTGQIIKALRLAALDAATNDGVQSYSLDDGQVKINKAYRSVEQIQKSIHAFEKDRQRLINDLDGNRFMILDAGNFKTRNL